MRATAEPWKGTSVFVVTRRVQQSTTCIGSD